MRLDSTGLKKKRGLPLYLRRDGYARDFRSLLKEKQYWKFAERKCYLRGLVVTAWTVNC